MSRDPQETGLTPIERSLTGLTPVLGPLDRDRLMYEAGRRSVLNERRRPWLWPAVAAALGGVAAGQSILLLGGRADRPNDRVVVHVQEPAAESPTPTEPVVILTRRTEGRRSEPTRSSGSALPNLLTLSRRAALHGLDEPPTAPLLTSSFRVEPIPGLDAEVLNPRHGRLADAPAQPGGPS